MKTISIGRMGCDIILPDNSISRKHATISLVNGQYVFCDMSKNGSTINGRILQNEKIVVAPGTPILLANKVPLPWPQVLMLLPNSGIRVETTPPNSLAPSYPANESIGLGWGIASFLIPLIGFILYFVWRDNEPYKAKQAAKIAGISIGIQFALGFISGLASSL